MDGQNDGGQNDGGQMVNDERWTDSGWIDDAWMDGTCMVYRWMVGICIFIDGWIMGGLMYASQMVD